VRRGLVWAVALLTVAPAAAAAPPQASIQATPTSGPAPLQVRFAATGDAATYHWDFGDSASADSPATQHTYAAGRWTVRLTARSSSGEETVLTTTVTASGLTLAAPRVTRFGSRTTFRGAVVPAASGVSVAIQGPRGQIGHARTQANGSYVIRARADAPGDYRAASASGDSATAAIRVVPKLVAGLAGSGARGSRYYLNARLLPAAAGELALRIARGGRVLVDRTYTGRVHVKLDTRRLVTYGIRLAVVPADGYVAAARALTAHVVLPRLAYGLRNPAVAQLGARLRALHYAAPFGATFDGRLLDAVYAFQKVQGLPRTGTVDARFWQALARARTPQPRYAHPADHIEVNKGRQVLYVVRNSGVTLIVPISTAGTAGAFTPVGRFSVIRKVGGFDPSPLGTLYDPMYFTGGYAIHGNPSVPPYPASHGCVRVPMWLAPLLYARTPYGQTVYVY
jgi:N-acetylmuramoyl-L-alanine amidase